MNSRFFKLCRVYSNSLEIKNVGVEPFISLTSRKIRKRHEFVISELSETLLQILQSSPVFSIGDSNKQSTTEYRTGPLNQQFSWCFELIDKMTIIFSR